MKRKALLMIELLIAMLIIAISAGAITLSPDIWTLTAKREAEKLAAKINSLMLQANATKTHFQLEMSHSAGTKIRVQWNSSYTSLLRSDNPFTEYINADEGCTYSWNANNDKVTYSYITHKYASGATITVTGRGPTYYVIIATQASRIRVSQYKPDSKATDSNHY